MVEPKGSYSAHTHNRECGCPGGCPFNFVTLVSLDRFLGFLEDSPKLQERREDIVDGSAHSVASERDVRVHQRVLGQVLHKTVDVEQLAAEQTSSQRRGLQKVLRHNLRLRRHQVQHLLFIEVLADEVQNVPRDVLRLKNGRVEHAIGVGVGHLACKNLAGFVGCHDGDLFDFDEVGSVAVGRVAVDVDNEQGCFAFDTGHNDLISRERVPDWSNVYKKLTKNMGIQVQSLEF